MYEAVVFHGKFVRAHGSFTPGEPIAESLRHAARNPTTESCLGNEDLPGNKFRQDFLEGSTLKKCWSAAPNPQNPSILSGRTRGFQAPLLGPCLAAQNEAKVMGRCS